MYNNKVMYVQRMDLSTFLSVKLETIETFKAASVQTVPTAPPAHPPL